MYLYSFKPKVVLALNEKLFALQHYYFLFRDLLFSIRNFSLLQVEHRTTELRAEEIERRVGSETSSLDEISVTSSTAASEHSLIRPEDRGNRYTGESFNRRKTSSETADTESGVAFPFTSHDPLDTRPLIIRSGRSHERLEDETRAPDTPGSLPSDSTESGGDSSAHGHNMGLPGWSSFDHDRERFVVF